MLPVVFDLIIPFLFEEEKVPVFLSSATFLRPYQDELRSIACDHHSLQEYNWQVAFDRYDYETNRLFLDTSSQDSVSS